MSLETLYQNPDVILTTTLSCRQKNLARYVRCSGAILVSVWLVSLGTWAFWGATLVTAGVVFWAHRAIMSRPTIVLEGLNKHLLIRGVSKVGKSQRLASHLIERVVVEAKQVSGAKSGDKTFLLRLIVKNKKNPKKKIYLNGFELKDIVQVHYLAQLVGAFCHCRALDFKGNALPGLKSHIPTRFLSTKSDNYRMPAPVVAKKIVKKAYGRGDPVSVRS